jgi:hypothetical protein
VGEMTIVVIHASRANHAGSMWGGHFCRLSNRASASGQVAKGPVRRRTKGMQGIHMPRGRSTFTKRQKEHTRQQRQRDKAERRNQRKQDKLVPGSVDEMAELRQHATAQAELFNIGVEETETSEQSSPDARIDE